MQQILPVQDSFENLCLRAEILEKIKFSSDEIADNKIVSANGQITWIEAEAIEYEFHPIEEKYIGEVLKKLSEEKRLQALQTTIYKLFVK